MIATVNNSYHNKAAGAYGAVGTSGRLEHAFRGPLLHK